jgi:hypothetical protein
MSGQEGIEVVPDDEQAASPMVARKTRVMVGASERIVCAIVRLRKVTIHPYFTRDLESG